MPNTQSINHLLRKLLVKFLDFLIPDLSVVQIQERKGNLNSIKNVFYQVIIRNYRLFGITTSVNELHFF